MRTQRSNSDARRLEFLAPGIAHSLGNSLFTIHGNARTMGLNGQATRQRNAILDAASRAEQVLHVLRLVTRDEVDGVRDQAGVLLKRLVLLCTLRMRERQLALRLAHTSKETPRAVDACRFARAVVDVLAAFCEELPGVVAGEIVADLAHQDAREVTVDFTLGLERTMLPFPLELPAIRRAAECDLEDGASLTEIGAAALRLSIPVP